MLPAYERLITHELDPDPATARSIQDPVGIGAVGGSGTRLMALIVTAGGLVPASPLNRAGDAMEWPPFKRLLTPEMEARYGRSVLMRNIFGTFEQLLIKQRERHGTGVRSSWKVPGTFFWLRELSDYFPRMQYIHLIRNGLDMAYSGNQNQIGNWAGHLGVEIEYQSDGKVRPRSMLEYWLSANEHALAVGRECLGDRMMLVRFEKLCEKPVTEVERVLRFLDLDAGPGRVTELAELIRSPGSLGRHRNFDWEKEFSPEQLRRLESLGYSV